MFPVAVLLFSLTPLAFSRSLSHTHTHTTTLVAPFTTPVTAPIRLGLECSKNKIPSQSLSRIPPFRTLSPSFSEREPQSEATVSLRTMSRLSHGPVLEQSFWLKSCSMTPFSITSFLKVGKARESRLPIIVAVRSVFSMSLLCLYCV